MISTLLKNAAGKVCCEDNLFFRLYTDHLGRPGDIIVGGVFDGCSTGTNSAFASQLFSYLFQKPVIGEVFSTQNLLIIRAETISVMNLLDITPMHMLSTIILFEYDTKTRQLQVRIFGDGIISVNGRVTRIEQDNEPDYMGYHLEYAKDFTEYLQKYPIRVFEGVDEFFVSTDGLDSFRISQLKESAIDPVSFLMDGITEPSRNTLKLRYNRIVKEGWQNTDDLGIIYFKNT